MRWEVIGSVEEVYSATHYCDKTPVGQLPGPLNPSCHGKINGLEPLEYLEKEANNRSIGSAGIAMFEWEEPASPGAYGDTNMKKLKVRWFQILHRMGRHRDRGGRGFFVKGTKRQHVRLLRAVRFKYPAAKVETIRYKCPDGCCDLVGQRITLGRRGDH